MTLKQIGIFFFLFETILHQLKILFGISNKFLIFEIKIFYFSKRPACSQNSNESFEINFHYSLLTNQEGERYLS